jgi:CubicO group peptidase (beta-lactamase class C family)
MNQKLIFILILVFSFSATGLVAQKTPDFSSRIDSLLKALDDNNKAMASVTITKNGVVEYSKAIGFIDNTGAKPVNSTPETRYRIGSISKMFTSVMILQLIEEKKLSLETPLSEFFSKIPNSKTITIADLLNHHSGLFNFTNSEDYPKWMTEPRSRQQLLDLFESQEPVFAPGTKGEYSNTNFVLLGFIIEDVTGKSYQENLTARITSRIGIKNTMYGGKINHAFNEASSFENEDSKWVILPETDMSIPHGAGAVISSTPDLTLFITALFDGKLLNENSLKSMTTMKDGFGLGTFKIPFHERYAFGHNGGIDGFSSSLAYFPEDKVAIAFCSNGMNYPMNDILIGLLSCYFDKPYKIPDFKTVAIPTDKLSAYEGEYTSEQLPLVITVKQDGGKLTAQATGQPSFPLDAISESEFRFDQAGIVMIFNLQASGNVDGFTLKQGRDFVYTKVVK